MNNVRLGIVGLGNMGKAHLANVRAGKVEGLKVTALCESVGTLPCFVRGRRGMPVHGCERHAAQWPP